MCNGVDLTDTTRYFTPKEFSKIGEEERKYLSNDKKRKEYKEKNSPVAKKISAEKANRHVAAIINGVMNATRNQSAVSTISAARNTSMRNPPPPPPMPQHEPHSCPLPTTIGQVQQHSIASNMSTITYEHNGIRNDYRAFLFPKSVLEREFQCL